MLLPGKTIFEQLSEADQYACLEEGKKRRKQQRRQEYLAKVFEDFDPETGDTVPARKHHSDQGSCATWEPSYPIPDDVMATALAYNTDTRVVEIALGNVGGDISHRWIKTPR